MHRKCTGAKLGTECADLSVLCTGSVVEERPVCRKVRPVRAGGAYGSENVGISSRKEGENPSHRKPKGSPTTMIGRG